MIKEKIRRTFSYYPKPLVVQACLAGGGRRANPAVRSENGARRGRLNAAAGNDSADLMIAATAIEHGLTVVTRNASDFAPTGRCRSRSFRSAAVSQANANGGSGLAFGTGLCLEKTARHVILKVMTKTAKQLLERVASWPEEDLKRLEHAAREIEAWRNGEYDPTEDELAAIDEAIAELDRGEAASEAEVRAAFAKFRSA